MEVYSRGLFSLYINTKPSKVYTFLDGLKQGGGLPPLFIYLSKE